ncbi:MAG: ABC transporter permease [Verrucomicrobiota bacterium]|nr:sugar ABC transporter permease [Verrucomicrobiales bacterium]MED5258577.1 ABC transporter permease [Verrucomicrobiota bacterium]|tara:strand:- start:1541 stop:2656 length:1116 start_codon:yes stop_codon:yes gene_type:complete
MNNSKLGFINNNRRELGMLGLLIALIVITSWGTRESGVQALFESKFLSADNLKNISREIGIYGIFSIGVGIVIITAGIDLSVGSLMALLGVVFLYFVTPPETRPDSFLAKVIPEIPWLVAVLFTLLIGTAIGVFQGLLVGKLKLQAFIVTLCGLLSYRGLARFSADDTSINISDSSQNLEFLRFLGEGSLSDVLSNGNGSGFLHSIPMSFIYLVCFAIFFGVLLHKSVFGRYIFAAGRNELATKYSGINTNIVIACAYVIAGFCTAFAAIPFCIYTGSVQPATHGAFFELYAIAAAVLGGCSLRGGEGSIIGILIGTAILIVLRNMVNLFGYPTPLSDAITGGVIFVGVLLDQHGASSIKKLFSKKPVSGN